MSSDLFLTLLPQLLSQKQSPLTRADLRYTNGFALSWPTANAAAPSGAPPSPPTPANGAGRQDTQGHT